MPPEHRTSCLGKTEPQRPVPQCFVVVGDADDDAAFSGDDDADDVDDDAEEEQGEAKY